MTTAKPTAPADLNTVRPPTTEELRQLWAWLQEERDAEETYLLREPDWYRSFWIAVFDDYCTGGPGYAGKLVYLVWDGEPSSCEVFVDKGGKLVHAATHGDCCDHGADQSSLSDSPTGGTHDRGPTKLPCIGVVRSRPGSSLAIHNDVGGTTYLPDGDYRVRLLKHWYDYETGERCIGELIDPADVTRARRVGTTGFLPEHYRKYGDEHYRKTLQSALEFDPSRVFFHLSEFTPRTLENTPDPAGTAGSARERSSRVQESAVPCTKCGTPHGRNDPKGESASLCQVVALPPAREVIRLQEHYRRHPDECCCSTYLGRGSCMAPAHGDVYRAHCVEHGERFCIDFRARGRKEAEALGGELAGERGGVCVRVRRRPKIKSPDTSSPRLR